MPLVGQKGYTLRTDTYSWGPQEMIKRAESAGAMGSGMRHFRNAQGLHPYQRQDQSEKSCAYYCLHFKMAVMGGSCSCWHWGQEFGWCFCVSKPCIISSGETTFKMSPLLLPLAFCCYFSILALGSVLFSVSPLRASLSSVDITVPFSLCVTISFQPVVLFSCASHKKEIIAWVLCIFT